MESSPPLAGLDDLLVPFHEAEKPRARFRIGTEAEKFGVFVEDGRPLPYEGERSVLTVFSELCDRHGWFPEKEHDAGGVIALRRGASSITLEPGGQLELSGAPQETVHQTCGEFRGHMAELHDISRELNIAWLGLGFHPFARQDDLPWVPKLRYGIMKDYLPTRGTMALDMMRRTATVQANLDYSSEADAMRKLRVSLAMHPIVTAMFANSPFVEGAATGERSHRAKVWLHMDPDRSGLLPELWARDATYRTYVEWALDVPMFLIKRDGQVLRNTGQTFRSFLADGFSGHRATMSDWEMHLNTLFPEARLKRFLEVRGADGQDTQMTCALPAFWKGILYHDEALSKAEALLSPLTYDQVEACRPEVAQRALGATLAGREVAEWANELLEISLSGLHAISNLNRSGDDERIHLKKLAELTRAGRTPADEILDRVDRQGDFKDEILAHARV